MTTLAARGRGASVWEQFIGGKGLTVALTGLVVLSVTLPLQQGNWVEGMPPLVIVALMGSGLAFVRHLMGMRVLTGSVIWVAVGTVLAIGAGMAVVPGDTVVDRIVNLVNDIGSWVAAVPTDEPRGGLAEFAMFLTVTAWLLGYFAVWLALSRTHGWITVLIGGVVVAFALTNLPGGAGWRLGLFMATGVMLIIHLGAVRRMTEWRLRGTAFDSQTVLAQSGIVLAFGLVVTAFVASLPTPGVAPLGSVARAFDDVATGIERQFGRLFSGLPSRREYTTITYDDTTYFRGNPNLTDRLLLTVTGGPPTYWRARTYTTYAGSGWETGEAETAPVEDVSSSADLLRVAQTYSFRMSAATDTLFTGGLPVAFGEPAEATVNAEEASDVLQVRFLEGREYFPTRLNLDYVSTGLESVAQPRQLRSAGDDYPDWVQTYLQLPESLPDRVRQLADSLVIDAENDYDRTVAVHRFVSSYLYNLDIDAPPEGADGVDHFLFESREGYCDYYASAAVVLLRAAGVPARYVVGYASGHYDPSRRAYRVLELNYHSWIEVYFPGYGWMPFEPTPANAIEFGGTSLGPPPNVEDPLEIDEFGEILEDEEDEVFFEVDVSGSSAAATWLKVLGTLGAALLVGLPSVIWYRWWWRLGRLPRPDELFAKMSRLGALLGIPLRPEQTPLEYAAELAREMPAQSWAIGAIARAYVLRCYAPGNVPLSNLRDAEWAWGGVRWAFIKRFFRVRPA